MVLAGMIDWELAIREIVANVRAGVAAGEIAARFHNTLVEAIIEVARFAGETCVVLSGGCFQNKYLTERAVCRLRERAFAHAGTSACRRTMAGSRWGKSLPR